MIGFGDTKMERTLPLSPKDFQSIWTDKPKEILWNPKRKVSGRDLLEDFRESFWEEAIPQLNSRAKKRN